MTFGDLLETLAARGASLYVDRGRLRYRGPLLEPNDPIRSALATFHDEILWMLTSGRLCVFCPRTLADGDRICCRVHRSELDATPMGRERDAASREDL